ncbi:MAG: DUF427 domain-containing protein [Rhodobacteraceae bacterium]|nr:DUF427 domain-containing protein [Paracoccaceae bacterium]
MNEVKQITSSDYGIRVERLEGPVQAFNGHKLIASSTDAKIMYETRLQPTVYFPVSDLLVDLQDTSDLNTFCPFKGTASYKSVRIGDRSIENAVWFYHNALPEAKAVENHVAFMPDAATRFDLGENVLSNDDKSHISGPTVDWILREAWLFSTPQELTGAIARKLIEEGVAISRMSVMIWSLHPLIAGKNYIWSKDTDEVQEFAPTYDIHTHPAFVNSPLRHVSNGLGGVRQRLTDEVMEFAFPIMEDLKAEGATDYVAMPLPFSDGQTNVLTLTCDHPAGFTTANLGLVFEISSVLSRYYEVFNQRENSQVLLETYLGKRTGARVLGGEIRRGGGDEIDAAILFCDLRNSTLLEEKLGRSSYLELLNSFFEQTTDIINKNGGEVLKFIGDAVFAIFPVSVDSKAACENVRLSAVEIVEHLDTSRDGMMQQHMDCAIGIAFGSVTYGNVGSRERLDFTVIGSAANIAARLADLGKSEGHKVVMTQEIAAGGDNSIRLGSFELHNVSNEVECYVLD